MVDNITELETKIENIVIEEVQSVKKRRGRPCKIVDVNEQKKKICILC